MAKNSNLTAAKKAKNDEFYTQISDIEKELIHYWDKLKGAWRKASRPSTLLKICRATILFPGARVGIRSIPICRCSAGSAITRRAGSRL